jgi:hypothetical protein
LRDAFQLHFQVDGAERVSQPFKTVFCIVPTAGMDRTKTPNVTKRNFPHTKYKDAASHVSSHELETRARFFAIRARLRAPCSMIWFAQNGSRESRKSFIRCDCTSHQALPTVSSKASSAPAETNVPRHRRKPPRDANHWPSLPQLCRVPRPGPNHASHRFLQTSTNLPTSPSATTSPHPRRAALARHVLSVAQVRPLAPPIAVPPWP